MVEFFLFFRLKRQMRTPGEYLCAVWLRGFRMQAHFHVGCRFLNFYGDDDGDHHHYHSHQESFIWKDIYEIAHQQWPNISHSDMII